MGYSNNRMNNRFVALLLIVLLAVPGATGEESPSLQGSVDQNEVSPAQNGNSANSIPAEVMDMPAPALPGKVEENGASLGSEQGQMGDYTPGKPLRATVKKSALHGSADENDPDLSGMSGSTDDENVLKGTASKDGAAGLAAQDPDLDDQELMVEWDKWRNRFLWTVQGSLTANMNDPDNQRAVWNPQLQAMVMMPRFPLGITAWFSCTVTKNRKILNLKLEHTSGYPEYDQAVLDAVRSLEGTGVLKFPGRSRRLKVRQMAGIKTSTTGERQFFKFGDVERYRVNP